VFGATPDAVDFAGAVPGFASPGCSGVAGAYLLAHLACKAFAWNTPSRPYEPSASACELSLNVSGGGSDPAYVTFNSFPVAAFAEWLSNSFSINVT
jgi:hypothetical protein